MSLRQKGLLAFVVLLLYAAGLSTFVLIEKQKLLAEVAALRDSYERERLVNNEHMTRVRTLAAIQSGMLELSRADRLHRLALIRTAGSDLAYTLPEGGAELSRTLNLAFAEPTARNVNALHDAIAGLEMALARDLERIRRHESGLLNRFNDRSDEVAYLALLLGLVGIVAIGFVSGGFLSRISRDLRTLETGASELLAAPGATPAVHRNDEVGRLGNVLSNVGRALRERDASEELNRRRNFHHEKSAAISSMAAGIIHEIGNPLAVISGQSELLAGRCRAQHGSESLLQEIREIDVQVERINQIVREIADYAAPDSVQWNLLDINHLLSAQYNRLRHESPFLDQFCRLQLDRSVPAIPAIAEQLSQLIASLLMNAVDAVTGIQDRMPEIVIASRHRGEWVELRVDDNGHGMAPEVCDRAFDAFYTTKPQGVGSGLGLSLCQSIVAAHEGRIELESELDRGTRVRVFLPVQAAVTADPE